MTMCEPTFLGPLTCLGCGYKRIFVVGIEESRGTVPLTRTVLTDIMRISEVGRMARQQRIISETGIYHIMLRGNERKKHLC